MAMILPILPGWRTVEDSDFGALADLADGRSCAATDGLLDASRLFALTLDIFALLMTFPCGVGSHVAAPPQAPGHIAMGLEVFRLTIRKHTNALFGEEVEQR